MEGRAIARRLGVSRNTVQIIIEQKGAAPVRPPKPQRIDEELLRRLYQECAGWMARMHEKLVEEEGIQVSYPTLTRMLRELGINQNQKARCERVPDEPGVENAPSIACGFDSDATGDAMANAMIVRHPAITRLRPSRHDWNDVLLSCS